MQQKFSFRLVTLFVLLAICFTSASGVLASPPSDKFIQGQEVTAFDLIIAMNTLRVSYGLSALVEDSIINAVAQSTAEIMAANQMSWHIGDVSGRLKSAGYGAGYTVWGTENFAVGSSFSIDEIMLVWSDPSHMIPAVNPAYCNVGAGVAKSSNGMTYYVLQAAYTTGKACGEYKSPLTPEPSGGPTSTSGVSTISQIIVPVKIATADAEGNIYHVVQAGQSFWSIAIAYKITIKDIETWNNISKDSRLPIGKRLTIPGINSKGYSTPTAVGMVQIATPDQDGKLIHTVLSYQTLTTISQAYGVTINTILEFNGIQEDWPLQIGQKLIIRPGMVTPSPTPRPLTPVEKLTPASDGKYYHEILSGETLSWVAQLYEVNIFDLMAWNGLSESSIIQPGQKILLQVTPPATITPTPAPATMTPTIAQVTPSLTPTMAPTAFDISPTVVSGTPLSTGRSPFGWPVIIGAMLIALILVAIFARRKMTKY